MASQVTARTILSDIAVNGLHPRRAISCIPGESDPLSQDQAYCNYYHPEIPDQPSFTSMKMVPGKNRIHEQLHSLVFNEKTGAYNIAIERVVGKKFSADKDFLEDLNRRVQNTVYLILNRNAIPLDPYPIKVFGDVGQVYDSLITHYEKRHQGSIPSKQIVRVLAPLHLVSTAREFFGDKVVPVLDCKTVDFSLGIVNDQAPMLEGSYLGSECKVSLIAPHYHDALTKLGPLLQTGFFTHVVRLPSSPDVEKKEGEKRFAVTVKDGATLLLLKNDQRFRIAKCYDRLEESNRFYVCCKEGDSAALAAIISPKKS